MTLYCGIDLHSTNHVVCLINDKDQRLQEKRFSNDPELTLQFLRRYRSRLKAVAIESTFNWYFLVDALQEAGFPVMLVNTAKVVQYSGLKHTDDRSDAFHLAHLMRLGILPTGYIYPKAERGLRDLLRKRMQLVQNRSSHLIRYKSMLQQHTGQTIRADKVKTRKYRCPDLGDENVRLGMESHVSMIREYSRQIKRLERQILLQAEKDELFDLLKTVDGIGDILALTILLEVGDIRRFKDVGNFASYSRCVNSRRESNGRKKGENNRKNGNKYLAWAFIEAANFAIRRSEKAKAFYQKKCREGHQIVARKALAHKLARACYWVMRKREVYQDNRLFC